MSVSPAKSWSTWACPPGRPGAAVHGCRASSNSRSTTMLAASTASTHFPPTDRAALIAAARAEPCVACRWMYFSSPSLLRQLTAQRRSEHHRRLHDHSPRSLRCSSKHLRPTLQSSDTAGYRTVQVQSVVRRRVPEEPEKLG